MIAVALYRCFDADGRLLYVGVSNQPQTRLGIHKAHQRNAHKAAWAERVANVTHEWYANRCDALIAERRATLTEHPEFPTTVTGPHSIGSAISGLMSDMRMTGYYIARDEARRLLAESGYLDDTTMTPRSEPLGDDFWDATPQAS